MRDGFKGLYWRRHGSMRYFTRQRVKQSSGGVFSKIERLKRAGMTTGDAA